MGRKEFRLIVRLKVQFCTRTQWQTSRFREWGEYKLRIILLVRVISFRSWQFYVVFSSLSCLYRLSCEFQPDRIEELSQLAFWSSPIVTEFVYLALSNMSFPQSYWSLCANKTWKKKSWTGKRLRFSRIENGSRTSCLS